MAKRWRYHAGEKGRNRVTVRERPDGSITLGWYEEGKRRFKSLGHNDREKAKQQADEVAAELAKAAPARKELESVEDLTLHKLFEIYLGEVTPTKGKSKRSHDERATRVFAAFFDAQRERSRHCDRHPRTLDRRDWDRFIEWRGNGLIPGWVAPVRARTVQYDLKYLISVLNWARGQQVGSRPMLAHNPWDRDIRSAQNWEMPKEANPRRPAMNEVLRARLIEHSPHWQFEAALLLQRETARRNNAIRQLLWSDVDLEVEEVRWRGEADKSERENVTPLSPKAVEVLRELPSRGIGKSPVFPSASEQSKPTPRGTFQNWLKKAKRGLLKSVEDEAARNRLAEQLQGLGFHAEKRAAVRDPRFRNLSPKVQEEFAGTNYATLRRVYDDVSVEEMRQEWRKSGSDWG